MKQVRFRVHEELPSSSQAKKLAVIIENRLK
jgi:hypothetical protein